MHIGMEKPKGSSRWLMLIEIKRWYSVMLHFEAPEQRHRHGSTSGHHRPLIPECSTLAVMPGDGGISG